MPSKFGQLARLLFGRRWGRGLVAVMTCSRQLRSGTRARLRTHVTRSRSRPASRPPGSWDAFCRGPGRKQLRSRGRLPRRRLGRRASGATARSPISRSYRSAARCATRLAEARGGLIERAHAPTSFVERRSQVAPHRAKYADVLERPRRSHTSVTCSRRLGRVFVDRTREAKGLVPRDRVVNCFFERRAGAGRKANVSIGSTSGLPSSGSRGISAPRYHRPQRPSPGHGAAPGGRLRGARASMTEYRAWPDGQRHRRPRQPGAVQASVAKGASIGEIVHAAQYRSRRGLRRFHAGRDHGAPFKTSSPAKLLLPPHFRQRASEEAGAVTMRATPSPLSLGNVTSSARRFFEAPCGVRAFLALAGRVVRWFPRRCAARRRLSRPRTLGMLCSVSLALAGFSGARRGESHLDRSVPCR